MIYQVTLRETQLFIVQVAADSEEEAKSTAWAALNDAKAEGVAYQLPHDKEGTADAVKLV